jgi:hypothetical protein
MFKKIDPYLSQINLRSHLFNLNLKLFSPRSLGHILRLLDQTFVCIFLFFNAFYTACIFNSPYTVNKKAAAKCILANIQHVIKVPNLAAPVLYMWPRVKWGAKAKNYPYWFWHNKNYSALKLQALFCARTNSQLYVALYNNQGH